MPQSTREFFRQVFTVEVLSDDAPCDERLSLKDLHAYIINGHCSANITCVTKEIDAATAARLLIAQGSGPEFFDLNDDGTDLEEP